MRRFNRFGKSVQHEDELMQQKDEGGSKDAFSAIYSDVDASSNLSLYESPDQEKVIESCFEVPSTPHTSQRLVNLNENRVHSLKQKDSVQSLDLPKNLNDHIEASDHILERSSLGGNCPVNDDANAVLEHYKKRKIDIYETFERDVRHCMNSLKSVEAVLDQVFNKAFQAAQHHIDTIETELTEEFQREGQEAIEVSRMKCMLRRMMSQLMQATQQIMQVPGENSDENQ